MTNGLKIAKKEQDQGETQKRECVLKGNRKKYAAKEKPICAFHSVFLVC